jgi:hypothetical protein
MALLRSNGVDLSTNIEDKIITTGSNSLKPGIKEHISMGDPEPILQNTINQSNGDINYEYVIWGNNQDGAKFSAFNNCGSYGYNFTLVNRNPGVSGPLFIKFDDDDPFKALGGVDCNECNLLQLDDWLPNGENSYWVGFNTNYDMYSSSNPEQTTGVIRTYTQNRLDKIIAWASSQPQVDPTRVYSSGFSHNGYGAMLTSVMIPSQIAATQMTVSPCLIKAVNGSDREGQWCASNSSLNSDIIDPNTGDSLSIWSLLDLRKTFFMTADKNLPFMSGVNGKQDVTVGWVQTYHWFDSVNLNTQGGVWFWDQRNHTGTGKNFTTDETNLDFLRFSTKKSYPAFAYCSINQNPGNGNVNDGDQYGAINGNLDWDDLSVSDQHCSYSINCFIKNFYVNEVLQQQYDSCTSDITIRRLQNFKPVSGDVINWKVTDSNNKIVQQGSFTSDGIQPLEIHAAKVYAAGSTISFSINNCQKQENTAVVPDQLLTIARTGESYQASVTLNESANVEVKVIDMMGRTVSSSIIAMQAGSNTFSLLFNSGAYVLQVRATGFSESRKLVF